MRMSLGASKRFSRRFDDELALECRASVARPAGRRHVSDRTPFPSRERYTHHRNDDDRAPSCRRRYASQTSACCPLCGSTSDRTHSRFRRTVADLPFGDRLLVVRLIVRRFKCGNAGCRRAVFCERLPKLVDAYARSTNRLKSLQRVIGTTAGGEAGSRLAEELEVPVSGDTLIRRVRTMPTEPEPDVLPTRPRFGASFSGCRKSRQRRGSTCREPGRGKCLPV
jgi:hypothetical protein